MGSKISKKSAIIQFCHTVNCLVPLHVVVWRRCSLLLIDKQSLLSTCTPLLNPLGIKDPGNNMSLQTCPLFETRHELKTTLALKKTRASGRNIGKVPTLL